MLVGYLQKKQKKQIKIPKITKTGDTRYIYQNELGKTCFQRDTAYDVYKYLSRRTASDKALGHNSFIIASMMDINEDLAQWSSNLLTKNLGTLLFTGEHEFFLRINNWLMKSWLHGNGLKMYSTYNEETFFVAERFIRNLKNTIYSYMTAVSKNEYTEKLEE